MAKFKKIKREKYESIGSKKGFLPSIHFNVEQLPEIKGWQVGEKYTISLIVKQTSSRKEDGRPQTAGFDIVEAKADSKLTKEQREAVKIMTGK